MKNSSFPSRDRFKEPSRKTRLPFSWPSSIPALIPHRMRRKLRSKVRSRQSPSSSFASIETSISPAKTLKALRAHRWSFYDGQYVILVILGIFTLCIIPSPGPVTKTGASTLLLASLIIPATRQFFLPLLPVITWLSFFYACGYVFSPSRVSLHRRMESKGITCHTLQFADLSHLKQIHTGRVAPSNMGSSLTGSRKHHVWRQP